MPFEKPEPSLCDNCKFSYYIEGGSCGITEIGKPAVNFKQRYCPKPPEGKENTNMGRAISMVGYRECQHYHLKC